MLAYHDPPIALHLSQLLHERLTAQPTTAVGDSRPPSAERVSAQSHQVRRGGADLPAEIIVSPDLTTMTALVVVEVVRTR